MNALPAVSVVLSTRNRCGVLGDALEALLDQEAGGLPYEILVVDNNSSDGTAALIRAFERRSGGVLRYVHEPREGVSNGRNAGIAASRGAIIAFTDDDVRASRGWLAAGVRRLMEHPDIHYVGGPVLPRWTAAPPRWLTRAHWSPLAAVDYGTVAFRVPEAGAVCLVTANLFVRRESLDRVGWFHPAFRRCQDHELMLRLWAGGLAGLYAPDVVTSTLVLPERLTRRYHRRWHQRHGHFLALMPLRARQAADGLVVEDAAKTRLFLGAPLFEYRALLEAAVSYCRALAKERADCVLAHEFRIRYSLSFIATAIRWRAGSATPLRPRSS